MRRPHHLGAAVLTTLVLSFSLFAQAQQPAEPDNQTTAQGMELYHLGKSEEAISVLTKVVKKHPDDADAWYFLGLAQYSQGWIGGARPSFEKTIELRPQFADAYAKLAYAQILANESTKALTTARQALELGDQSVEAHYAIAEASLRLNQPGNALDEATKTLQIKADFLPALITQSFAHYSLAQFSEAAESLGRVLSLNPDDLEAETWRNQIDELRNRASQQPGQLSLAFTSREVTDKARVLSKAEPPYTERARKGGAMGTVVLRAILSPEGEVKHILVLRALGYGLTTNAVKAARGIKFSPAVKDGQPVAQQIQLEYTFNLY